MPAGDDPIATLAADPVLGPVVEEHGPVTIEPAEDIFRRLVVSVTRQQVSMTAAEAVEEQLFDRFEVTPTALAAADPAALQETGLSEAKAGYVRAIARAFEANGYDRPYFEGVDDDAVVTELTGIRGVGPWTAKMFLLFCLGREDVFPFEDLGVRKGMQAVYGEELTRAEMRDRADAWRPYRSYATRYLWRAVEG
jgi:DNA-3-methyladenine glycosylase II